MLKPTMQEISHLICKVLTNKEIEYLLLLPDDQCSAAIDKAVLQYREKGYAEPICRIDVWSESAGK